MAKQKNEETSEKKKDLDLNLKSNPDESKKDDLDINTGKKEETKKPAEKKAKAKKPVLKKGVFTKTESVNMAVTCRRHEKTIRELKIKLKAIKAANPEQVPILEKKNKALQEQVRKLTVKLAGLKKK